MDILERLVHSDSIKTSRDFRAFCLSINTSASLRASKTYLLCEGKEDEESLHPSQLHPVPLPTPMPTLNPSPPLLPAPPVCFDINSRRDFGSSLIDL